MGARRAWHAAQEDVYVVGCGASTSLGLSLDATTAAVRAGIPGLALQTRFTTEAGDLFAMALNARLDFEVPLVERLRQMLVSALIEAGAKEAVHDHLRWCCLLVLPEPRPGFARDEVDELAHSLTATMRWGSGRLRTVAAGHAAGLTALQAAFAMIAQGVADLCIVCGADSYCDAATVAWLDSSGRLKSGGNRDGFHPGEAAAACVVAGADATRSLRLSVHAQAQAAAAAVERHTVLDEAVCVGDGLTRAIRAATARLDLTGRRITATYCDLNGQRYRNEELLYALLRTQSSFEDAHDYLSPADCWGDVGAATGVLLTALSIGMQRRYGASGCLPLIWASSESGERGAVVLRLPPQETNE